jgi:serine/threonine protein kinase/hemoglobin-like flavoprotein/Ran GTPase-activating protein (RanGAP) involved in mRNA processing and transport
MPSYCHHCFAPLDDPTWSRCPECDTVVRSAGWPQDSRLGSVVAGGQFRVRRRLGRGGFGTVFLVETLVGGLRRAMKVLHPELGSDPTVRDRLVQEALVLERVNHPNVARCYAVGTLDDQDALYLLLELVEGQTLSALLTDTAGGPLALDPLRAVRLVRQVASGLVAVHQSGALHRDLKPQNILVARAGTRDEQVKLVDFGLAKVLVDTGISTHQLIGTPAFMAPEQLRPDLPVDARTDLWQLGAVLHTALTGCPPYDVSPDYLLRVIREHEAHEAAGPRPSRHRPELSALQELDALVSSLLASDPDRRPRSAAIVCAELARLEHVLTPQQTSGTVALLDALCASPGDAAWWSLCQYLTRATEEPIQLAHDAEIRLAGWPDDVRRAPLRWWEEVRRAGTPLWPLARSLDLRGRGLTDADLQELARCDALASITQLELADNGITDAGVLYLAGSAHLRHLRRLGLARNRLTSTAVEHLAERGMLGRLEYLDISGNGVGTFGAEVLAARAQHLVHLELGGNAIGAAGAAALAGSPALAGLRTLGLSSNDLGSDGVAELATSRALEALTALDLSSNAIGPGGTAALAVAPAAFRLQRLELQANALGPAALEVLLTSSRFGNLRHLNVAGNALDATGAMLLASTTFARRLKWLDVSDNAIGDAGLAALLGGQPLAGVWTLAVARNGITGAAVPLLTKGPAELGSLDLSGNPLQDEGLRALAAALARLHLSQLSIAAVDASGAHLGQVVDGCQGWLRTLDVSRNELKGAGFVQFLEAEHVRQLQSLNLTGTGLDACAVQALTGAGVFPRLETLVLDGLHLGDMAGADVVRALEGLPALRHLSLADNRLSSGTARALLETALTHRLARLDLSHNLLGDDGAGALARGTWHTLRELDIEQNDVSLGGIASLLTSPTLPLLWRLDASHNAVGSAIDLHVLSAGVVATIESSFSLIATAGADFAARFYEAFFRRHPGVVPLFRKSSMRRQHQHLMGVLTAVVDNLRHPDALADTLGELAHRHVGYGVAPSQYYAMSAVLLDAIRETLGDRWTPDVEEAWHDGLTAVTTVMLQAHRQRGAEETAIRADSTPPAEPAPPVLS